MQGIENHPDSLVNLIIDMIENEAFWRYVSKPRVKWIKLYKFVVEYVITLDICVELCIPN